jgi:hypothetical protein
MNKYICKAKRIDNGEWVYGSYLPVSKTICTEKTYLNSTEYIDLFVIPETVCRYTEMTEFVMADKSICAPLFEGDIVEIHSVRCPYAAYPQSKYDGPVKARAVIYFERGMWRLNYDNGYNKKMCEPRGNEQYERSVNNSWELYYFGYHGRDENKYREQNKRYHYHDIVKIGNIYDNFELLEE